MQTELAITVLAAAALAAVAAWAALTAANARRLSSRRAPSRRRGRRGKRVAERGAVDVSSLTGMERRLAKAGLDVSPTAWAAGTAAVALGVFAAASALTGPAFALLAAAAAAAGGALWLSARAKKRERLFEKQLCQAELQIAENLRSGLSVARSLRAVSEQVEEPLKGQFDAVYNEMTYSGATLPEALASMSRRTANRDVQLLATVVRVQDETGSDLSDSLEFLSETLARKTEMRNQVKVALSEVRATIKIVAAMPPVALAVVSATYEGYAGFYASPEGTAMLAVCAVLEVAALALLARMTDVKLD